MKNSKTMWGCHEVQCKSSKCLTHLVRAGRCSLGSEALFGFIFVHGHSSKTPNPYMHVFLAPSTHNTLDGKLQKYIEVLENNQYLCSPFLDSQGKSGTEELPIEMVASEKWSG